jgi:cytochrome c biogenesis protein CcdA
MNYVYERPYALLTDLKIDAAIPKGTKLNVRVRADWLACTDRICVPEGDDLSIELTAGDGAVTNANAARFDQYRAALPVPLDRQAAFAVSGAGPGKFIEIAVPFAATATLNRPYFFALTADVIDYPVPQSARRIGDWLIIKAGYRGQDVTGFSGVLRYGDGGDGAGQGLIISAVPGAIPSGGEPVITLDNGNAPQPIGGDANFALILFFSVLGGLILNLMPCVFPILGLKALSLAKLGGGARAAKRDALAYAGGVILSTMLLGGIMLLLRAAGEQVGWAFQLQEPRIVLLLFLLMVAVTLNLLGQFELATVNVGDAMARKQGAAGSFWTGVLAAIVATPCTGPFMAAALGAALVLPAGLALAIFAGLGFGLALPYLAIGFVPRLRGILPKPGPWLENFRKLMALPMALTAAALLWLLWRLSGEFGLMLGGGAGATILVLLLFIGRAQRSGGMLPPIMAVSVLALSALAVSALPSEAVQRSKTNTDAVVSAEPFSEALLDRYRKQRKRVFVYFTADWCVTCKINEANAIQRDEVAAAFRAADVKVLEGDFTTRDPALARTLAAHGRSGVPLYLFYGDAAEPKILGQILTVDDLVSAANSSGAKVETRTGFR